MPPISQEKFLGTPWIKPRAAGCEASMLPLCYAPPLRTGILLDHRQTNFQPDLGKAALTSSFLLTLPIAFFGSSGITVIRLGRLYDGSKSLAQSRSCSLIETECSGNNLRAENNLNNLTTAQVNSEQVELQKPYQVWRWGGGTEMLVWTKKVRIGQDRNCHWKAFGLGSSHGGLENVVTDGLVKLN